MATLNQRDSRTVKDIAYKALDAVVDDLDETAQQPQTFEQYQARIKFLRATLREIHNELMDMVN